MSFRTCRILALAAALASTAGAQAQLRLPPLGSTLSPIARAPVLQRLDPEAVLAPVDLAMARLDAVKALSRAHRRELARDPAGELIVRAEVLAQPSSPAARNALLAAGFGVLREETLDGLADALIVMSAPRDLDLADAVARARAIDPAGAYDFHHLYLGSGGVGAPASAPASSIAPPPSLASSGPLQVGLIDSGVDEAHPSLRHADMRRHGCADGAHPAPHGTAVASLLVGSGERFRSAVPRAVLYAGDAYCDAATGGSVEAIARELAWLARLHVAVVNISLVGPDNQILRQIIERSIAQGMLVVACLLYTSDAADE